MDIGFVGPLQRAVARARGMLFRPFRLETWLTLGFAAFLSEWASGGWSQGGWRYGLGRRDGADWGRHAWPDAFPPLVCGPLLAGLVLLLVLVGLALLWVSSRGKFVFLDGVVRQRAAIVEPWRRFARQGDSLFLWRLVFFIVVGLVMGAVAFGAIGTGVLSGLLARQPVAMVPSLVGGVALVVLCGLAFGFVSLLLDEFVVPIMYRHGLSATDAWRRFLPLLRRHPGRFVLYALFLLLLGAAFLAAVMVVGFATCCVGFLLVGAPYVGQVVLLPVYVAFRGLGPQFLAQFGADYDAFAEPAAGSGTWTPV